MIRLILLSILCLPLQAQTILSQFDGEQGTAVGTTPTYRDHGDCAIALNGYQMMEVCGQDVNVYSYSGTLLKTTPLATFITASGVTAGVMQDPRVWYSPFIQRWLVVCSCSSDYLMVSSSADATGTYKGVALSANTGDLTMNVAGDMNQVCATESVSGGGANNTYCLLNSAVAWTGSGTIDLSHEGSALSQTWDIRPVADYRVTKLTTDPMYFIGRTSPAQNQTNAAITLVVVGYSFTGTTFNSPTSNTVSTPFLYNTPLDASQPSSPPLRGAENHRFSTGAAVGSHIFSVVDSGPCASSCGTQGVDTRDGFFWFDVNTLGFTLAQSAKVFSSTLDYFQASIAADIPGNVGITAAGLSSSQNVSVYSWYHLTSDSAGILNGPNLVTAGTATYSCAVNPVGYGNYNTSGLDPGDGTVLASGVEYANSSTACSWGTRIFRFRIGAAPVASPGPSLNGVRM